MTVRLNPIGIIRSTLKTRVKAPKQGVEGAPDAWLEVKNSVARALEGIAVGDEIIVITYLHRARRDALRVHPRSDKRRPLTGVFATRSPDRPNPLGLHRVAVKAITKNRMLVGPIEATPPSLTSSRLSSASGTNPDLGNTGLSMRRSATALSKMSNCGRYVLPACRSEGEQGVADAAISPGDQYYSVCDCHHRY